MTTLKQLKDGATLPTPIYVQKKYVILSQPDGMVLATANSIDELKSFDKYWDDCFVNIRLHHLYGNNNTKVEVSA